MDIMGLANTVSAVHTGETMNNIDIAVLSQAMETDEQMGASMANMLEHSVTPYKGDSIDIRV